MDGAWTVTIEWPTEEGSCRTKSRKILISDELAQRSLFRPTGEDKDTADQVTVLQAAVMEVRRTS